MRAVWSIDAGGPAILKQCVCGSQRSGVHSRIKEQQTSCWWPLLVGVPTCVQPKLVLVSILLATSALVALLSGIATRVLGLWVCVCIYMRRLLQHGTHLAAAWHERCSIIHPTCWVQMCKSISRVCVCV